MINRLNLFKCLINIKITTKIFICFFIILYSNSVFSDDFIKGQEAYKNNDFVKAFSYWQPLALKGNKLAQYKLGILYEKGKGINQDSEKTLSWWKLAAENGHARSQYHFGVMHYQGKGTSQNFKKAAKWIMKSAEQGDKFAHSTLGFLYMGGHGVKQSLIYSYIWLEIASRNGSKLAKQSLKDIKLKMNASQITNAKIKTKECILKRYKDC